MKRLPATVLLALMLAAPAGAQTTTLHIGTTPTDTGAQVYYAMDLGLFKKAGFELEVSSLNAGTAIATAVSAGSFDIGQSAVSSLAVAHEHAIPFVQAQIRTPDAHSQSALPVASSKPTSPCSEDQ